MGTAATFKPLMRNSGNDAPRPPGAWADTQNCHWMESDFTVIDGFRTVRLLDTLVLSPGR